MEAEYPPERRGKRVPIWLRLDYNLLQELQKLLARTEGLMYVAVLFPPFFPGRCVVGTRFLSGRSAWRPTACLRSVRMEYISRKDVLMRGLHAHVTRYPRIRMWVCIFSETIEEETSNSFGNINVLFRHKAKRKRYRTF